MLEFKPIECADQQAMNRFLLRKGNLSAHRNFTTLYMWGKLFDQQWCEQDGWLFIRAGESFYLPLGEEGKTDLTWPVEQIKAWSDEHGVPLTIWGVEAEERQRLEAAFPGKFLYQPMREYADYVYGVEKLSELAGKKLHGKRNHINKFIQLNPDWRFETITAENIDEVYSMNQAWCRRNDCNKNSSLQEEACAVRRCFRHYEELGLLGGLIRDQEGKVVAYSMASPLGTEAVDVHIEKAFAEVAGAYTIINREMVRYLKQKLPGLLWINREDDTGDEGLRKAKLSYQPDLLVEKELATW